jgi:two-component system C4-dicarboxylate transport sensor histidine kinase DctB
MRGIITDCNRRIHFRLLKTHRRNEGTSLKAASRPMKLLGRSILWSLVLALFAAIVYLGSSWSEQTGIAKLRERGTHRLDLYTLSLDAELSKYDYLPTLLSLNPEVVVLLKIPKICACVNR